MKPICSFLFLLFSVISFSQIKIPNGFSEVTKSPSNGKKIEKVVLNFDDDNLLDEAVLVENEFSNYKLLMYLTSLQKQYEVDLLSTNYAAIYPIPLKTNKNVIQFGYFEDGTATFGRFIKIRFYAETQQIQVIGYDCSYKSSPTSSIEKSYNLLTGKYKVKRINYNEIGKATTEEFSGENNYFKNNVFLESLDLEMFVNLDDVGSKYIVCKLKK
jgi:hypothetical protein